MCDFFTGKVYDMYHENNRFPLLLEHGCSAGQWANPAAAAVKLYLKRRIGMESVINKLTEIEAAASRILEGAANQNKLLDQQQDARIAAFDQKLEDDTARQLQKTQADLRKKTDDELLHLRSGTSDLLASLDDYYKKNHDTLSTQICEKLIRK